MDKHWLSEGNSMIKEWDLHAAFKLEKMVMTVGGFYPTRSSKYRAIYIFNAFIVLSINLIQCMLMNIFVYYNISDLVNVSEVLLYYVSAISLLFKVSNLLSQRENLLKLDDMLKIPIFTKILVEKEGSLKNYIRNARFVGTTYKSLCFMAVLFMILYPFNAKNREFPLLTWYPFNPQNYYYQVYIFQSISIISCALFSLHADILAIIAIVLGTIQFEMLKSRLADIAQHIQENERKEEDNKLVQKRLRRCIIHYNCILRFVSLIEATYARGIFVQFLTGVIVICLTGFQIAVTETFDIIQFTFFTSYILCMIWQVGIYCWYGHMLMHSSDKLTEASYMADWRKCSVSVQKSLIIIMERAKGPVLLRAAKIVPLNLETFVTILRSSYSYFAVLQRVYTSDSRPF